MDAKKVDMWPFKKKKKRKKKEEMQAQQSLHQLERSDAPAFIKAEEIHDQLKELTQAVNALTESMGVVLPVSAKLQELFSYQEELYKKNLNQYAKSHIMEK